MRVLIVIDRLQHPDARADLDLLTTHLDPKRIQLLVCSLCGSEGDIRLGVHWRLDPRAWWRLRRVIRRYEIELIHALEPGTGPCVAAAGCLTGVPTVATFYHVESVRDKNWLQRQLMRLRWRLATLGIDRIVVPFEVVKRNLLYALDYRHDRIEIISPGMVPPENGLKPDREALGLPAGPLVTMLPPPELDMGYEVVLEALTRLIKRQPDVHLAVVGSGATVSALQRKASNIRPALPIWWLGARSDVWEVIAASDVIIDASSSERVPQGLIMAALAGKPVVAPRLLSTAEIIEPNVNGLMVTPGDANDLALQINRLLQYEGLSHRLSRVARRRALERFSVDAQHRAMVTLYEATVYATR